MNASDHRQQSSYDIDMFIADFVVRQLTFMACAWFLKTFS